MDAEAFRNFERAAHERVAGGYHDFFEPMTGGAIMALLDAARVRAGCRVLDVASGPGGVAAAAAERGASRVIGADLSSRMVALAATLHPGVEFREADAEALPFDAGAFDAVVSNFGVGHFPSPERAMAEFVRVLAGGTAAWIDAGFALERRTARLASATDDVYYRPYDGKSQIEQAMKDYLDWEVGLAEQIRREPYLTFKAPPA